MLPANGHELGGVGRRRSCRTLATVEQRNLAERIARLHDVEIDLAAVRRTGADADPTDDHSIERIAGIALREDDLPGAKLALRRERRQALQGSSSETAEEWAPLQHHLRCEHRHG